jgi:hypothetical protein
MIPPGFFSPSHARKTPQDHSRDTGCGRPAVGRRYWPEHGVANPCRGALPDSLARHELVTQAWAGDSPQRVDIAYVERLLALMEGMRTGAMPSRRCARRPQAARAR